MCVDPWCYGAMKNTIANGTRIDPIIEKVDGDRQTFDNYGEQKKHVHGTNRFVEEGNKYK